jgi:NAD(P)-dependent dehydrogenase (short-subunit alcohol dehydrogenase family)
VPPQRPVPPLRGAYTTSKRCCILLARQLAREVSPERVSFVAFDPGLVPGTGLGREGNAALRLAWHYVLPAFARWRAAEGRLCDDAR